MLWFRRPCGNHRLLIVSAPGKVVLWGEYAVLAGAPAMIMAIDRYARVSVSPSQDSDWHFTTAGWHSQPIACPPNQLPTGAAANFVSLVLEHWGLKSLAALNAGACCAINSDSGKFFADARHAQTDGRRAANPKDTALKLGIGSSAAICNASYVALCTLSGRKPSLEEALALHRRWQHGKGSGLDIASSWHGGVIQFQAGRPTPAALPKNLHWQLIWSGRSASTADHINSFEQWRARGQTQALDDLVVASQQLCQTSISMAHLRDYQSALATLDQHAQLNIFTTEHTRLVKLATASGVLYKPCGAGGGDIGIGFADDPHALRRFRQEARSAGFQPLTLEMAKYGVTVERRA